MAVNRKQLQQLKASQRRRARRPVPTFQAPCASMKVTKGERNRITNSDPHLLLAVEKSLQASWEEDDRVDDQAVVAALRLAAAHKTDADSEVIAGVLRHLHSVQEATDSLEDFQLAVRVIHSSATTRSDCRANNRSYLSYAKSFVNRY